MTHVLLCCIDPGHSRDPEGGSGLKSGAQGQARRLHCPQPMAQHRMVCLVLQHLLLGGWGLKQHHLELDTAMPLPSVICPFG